MEASAAESVHRDRHDRRSDLTLGRRSAPSMPPSATSKTANGRTSAYQQLADIVEEIGLGLIDLGVQPGERVCILANTRPEWSYADMAITSVGAVVVPIYQTNSPGGVPVGHLRLRRHRDRGRGRGPAGQDRARSRTSCRNLRTVIVMDPPPGEAPLDVDLAR